ncbi:MAG: Mrp/NBP35 family ATP-binding protein [Oscillospiraceae bacterium]|nr:Mrp/NBP35 family ATP-binding protein [bacterium]MDY5101145.1 Mrp/NBP35 family ATP-binding protein [Oscillospiraceae bacterium]
MSEECTHDCKTCSQNCAERDPASFLKPLNPYSRVGKVIGVVSGKGGVGKSMVTSLLAVNMARRGHKVGILDADITGPSIPQAFGIHGNCLGSEMGIEPAESERGLKVMSINLLLENETDPVVWRGSVISGAVTQFWTDVHWGEVDYLFVDMPPGTGDVPLTVFQSLPVDGVVVVSTPQELVGMIVEKCVNMAGLMDKQVVGLVENMSYFKCPDCGSEHSIFGESRVEELAGRHHIPATARLPMDPQLTALCDGGRIEEAEGDWLGELCDAIAALPERE